MKKTDEAAGKNVDDAAEKASEFLDRSARVYAATVGLF